MGKYLIVNADDFGLTPAVNRGIVEAHARGIVTSASMMANMPGYEDAVAAAKGWPALSVGLHFNLTYGRPLTDGRLVPSLVDEQGNFRKIIAFDPSEVREIRAELEAQWNRLFASGISPTHLDSHQLLHQQYPSIYRIMAEFAVRRRVPLRRSQIPIIEESPWSPEMTDNLLLDEYGGQDGLRKLTGHLHNLPDGVTELTCHPGYVDEELRKLSDWNDVRIAELSALVAPEFKRTIQSLGVRLVSYRDLQEVRSAEDQPVALPAQRPLQLPAQLPASPPTQTKRRRKRKAVRASRLRRKKKPRLRARRRGR